jgi:hypothetical protein
MTVWLMICLLRRSAAAFRAVGVMAKPRSAVALPLGHRKPRDALMLSKERGPRDPSEE